MSKYFIPYKDNNPAVIEIKGHKLVLVGTNDIDLAEDELELVGANKVKIVNLKDNPEDELSTLAKKVKSGIVITPPGMNFHVLISNLEKELPWIH